MLRKSCFVGYLSTNTKTIPQSPQSLFFVSLWENCLRHIRLDTTLVAGKIPAAVNFQILQYAGFGTDGKIEGAGITNRYNIDR